MYVYLYDSVVREPKYQAPLARVETRLTDLGIAGKICRLSLLTSISEHIDDAIKKGADTIVAVGNDHTLSNVLAIAAGRAVTFGLIPLGQPSRLAERFDIPTGERACDVLSARIIERIDVGQANHHFFINQLEIPGGSVTVNIGRKYSVRWQNGQPALIGNLVTGGWPDDGQSDPRDGLLDLIVPETGGAGLGRLFAKPAGRTSLIHFKTAEIVSDSGDAAAVADGQTTVALPISLSVAARQLKLIVGRNRRLP